MRQPPFDGLPGEGFVYHDPLLDSLLESAREAVLSTAALVLLSGPDGSGRSLQLMRLLGVLPEGMTLVAFRGRAGIGFEVVEATIRNQLGIKAGALDEALLSSMRAGAGAGLLLAVDDAHLLGADVLHGFLRLRHTLLERTGDAPPLLLVGDSSLGRRGFEPGEVAPLHLTLRPFNLEQSGAYLLHRLEAAGLDNPHGLLSDADIDTLHRRAQGLPKALNALGNDWLEARCRDADVVTDPLAERLRRLNDVPDQTQPEPPPRATSATDAAASTPPSDEDDETMATTAFAELMARIARESAAATESREETEEQPDRQSRKPGAKTRTSARATSAASSSTTPIWNRRWFVPAMAGGAALAILLPVFLQLPNDRGSEAETSRQAARALLEAAPEPAASNPGEGAQEFTIPLPPRSAPESRMPLPPMSAPSLSEAPAQAPRQQPITSRADPEPPPARVENTPVAPADPPPARALPDLADGRAWLSAQRPERFTIQLIAVSSLDAAFDYVDRHGLGDVHYIPIRSRQRDLVVALAGAFADRAAAERAYRALPEAVRADQPWIRAIGSVRDSLR
ncbi:MAG: SPOR domain-containing protein [Chromatiaceae bacterium]|nr:SPOR domain-containing protein [Chromatiaceae bacterium]